MEFSRINPLPDMPILGYSNSTANKDMMSKIWTDGDTVISLSWKLVTSNFSFSHNGFKCCLLLMRQNGYLWSKGLNLWWKQVIANRTLSNFLHTSTYWKKEKQKKRIYPYDYRIVKWTHSHTITPFDAPRKQAFWKHCGKRRNCS